MCTWVISSLRLRGSSTLICNTDKKDSGMRTPWISYIINCSGIVSSLTPLKLVQPRSARMSWKMLHQSGELLFTTPPWQTLRKLSMPSILHNHTFTKLGSNLISGVIETGVPGERDAPTKPLGSPWMMKIVCPLNLWGYWTWKGMRTQIGSPFNHQNKPSPSNPKCWDQETQMFPFSPQDQVMSNFKCFAGPCYACGSEKHWLRACLKRGDHDKLKN